MKPAIILLMILVVGGAIVWIIDKLFYKQQEDAANENESDASATTGIARQGCADEGCGLRSICPSEQMLAGECKQEIIYYDDEELDNFAGRSEDDYTPEDLEQWRDVLYTLQPAELLEWGQSIRRRGLIMPQSIRQEFLQLAAEHRSTGQ
ncbi:MAG: hypothetical protein IKZ92_01690 [Muribaculaceae bacterium]|nr:hypothetical protein [Muribaculaceae bacterium]